MARPRKVRKASEEGIAKTLYLRRGTVVRAQREVRKDRLYSLSAFVEAAMVKELDAREEQRKAS